MSKLNQNESSSSSSSAAAAAAAAAATLASTNAQVAAKTAAESASIIAVVANDVSWMKKSLEGIELKLNEMEKAFVTATQHQEVLNEIADHESRIRVIETRTWIWVGGLAVLTFLIPILLKVFFNA